MDRCDVKSVQPHCKLHYRLKKKKKTKKTNQPTKQTNKQNPRTKTTTTNKIKHIGRPKVQYFLKEVNLQEKTPKVKMCDLLLNSLWSTEKCTDENIKT